MHLAIGANGDGDSNNLAARTDHRCTAYGRVRPSGSRQEISPYSSLAFVKIRPSFATIVPIATGFPSPSTVTVLPRTSVARSPKAFPTASRPSGRENLHGLAGNHAGSHVQVTTYPSGLTRT